MIAIHKTTGDALGLGGGEELEQGFWSQGSEVTGEDNPVHGGIGGEGGENAPEGAETGFLIHEGGEGF
jgi:hypothetical protein